MTLIQRFGSALNLNIHFHMLFLDGVYVGGSNRRPVRFVMNLNWLRERGLIFLHDFTIAFSRT